MYRHRRYLAGVAVVSLFLLSLVLLSAPAAGFELPQPDHGVEDGFDRLWSAHDFEEPEEGGSASDYLTHSSDFFYAEPPSAPERWNEGEVGEFEGGGGRTSVHPPDANLSDGDEGLIHDAYVSLFAVSPSTLVHYSPDREVLYVSDSGEAHGFVDYRVEGADRHSVEVELAETGDAIRGTRGFTLDYDELGRETLTLRATVEAERDEPDGVVTDTVVVNDTVEVQPYNVSTPSTVALGSTYPDGDSALFVVRGTPWSSVTLPNGATLYSNWRFFSARDTDWDEPMVVETAAGGDGEGETYHPLQVHAYPSRGGVYVDGEARVRKTLGDAYEPPDMPEGVNVDVVNSTYTTARAADLRYDTEDGDRGSVTVSGIVAGPDAPATRPPVNRRIRATNLSLSVVEHTENGVSLRVSLRDADGDPIDTRSEGGIVRLEGRTNVTTELDGTATVNVTPRPSGAVFARYVPNDWHDSLDERRGRTPYEGDSETVTVRSRYSLLDELGMLLQLAVFILPLVLMTYMLDRAFGLGVWPPWRRI